MGFYILQLKVFLEKIRISVFESSFRKADQNEFLKIQLAI